jgi:hypothetical protein
MPDETPPQLPEDGPTRLVEGNDGELVERLSGGTATLLLVWLVGVGAGSALLAAWLLAALSCSCDWGPALLGAPGLSRQVGATGPTVLWLTGRAQGHSCWSVTGQDGAGDGGGSSSAAWLVTVVMGAALGGGGGHPRRGPWCCGAVGSPPGLRTATSPGPAVPRATD